MILLALCAAMVARLTKSMLPLPILGLAVFALAQKDGTLDWVPFDRTQFNGSIALDTIGDVQLFWKTGDEYSTFGVASRSSGYLALGFSETGAMTGADMAVGYTDQGGKFVFENRHAAGFFSPEVSADQKINMRFKEGHQANGVTGFVFEKHNVADCVNTQVNIEKNAWQWFIYAFSKDNTFAKHAPGDNGKQYVQLGTSKAVALNQIQSIADAQNFTLVQPEHTLPTAETTYCYTLHKMPAGKRSYLLGERPPTPGKLLHHMVVYACYGLPDSYLSMLGQQPNCDFQTFSNPCNGFVTEWAPGMSARTFEPGYGKPFGSDLYEYVMFETHYNNPQGLIGEKDSASYTFVYNNATVPHEVGSLTLGDLQVSGWYIEPGKRLAAHSTVCTPQCTDNWPAGGITAVSVFHHMHFRGRRARVQIIRNGKEITPLSSLYSFEYGYQFSKQLNPVQLLPGDQLITTCWYDTTNDTKPVPGGPASKDEMCFAWIDYYPANNILACTQVDLGSSPANPLNGTAALCLESNASIPNIYPSTALTDSFQQLPISGNTCATGNTTSGSSGPNQAAVLKTCPETDICFSLNVPQQSASSGSGDIFFQLSAPTAYSWIGLGQGTMMSNANIFVMYSSADGKNVTLSPRHTSGHVMPTYNNAADVTLLDGSGIANGRMTANVRCANCNKGDRGTMNLKGTNSDWIYAHLSGSPINSDDTNVVISKHDGNGAFQWDLSRATGGSDVNPFTSTATTVANSSSAQSSWDKLSAQVQTRFIRAHGALAAIAFVATIPISAVLIRLTSVRGQPAVWIHGGVQIFAYTVFIAAAGLGLFIAKGLAYLNRPHAIIGMILLGAIFFMPFLGTVHHRVYKKVQKRTLWSYAHIFIGRAAVILGLVNGGLGLRLASAPKSNVVAYGVFAGLVGVVYVGVIVFGEYKRARTSSNIASTSASNMSESKQQKRNDSGSDSPPEANI